MISPSKKDKATQEYNSSEILANVRHIPARFLKAGCLQQMQKEPVKPANSLLSARGALPTFCPNLMAGLENGQ